MGEVILTSEYKAKPGMLYYCTRDAYGFVQVCEAALKRGGTKKEDRKER